MATDWLVIPKIFILIASEIFLKDFQFYMDVNGGLLPYGFRLGRLKSSVVGYLVRRLLTSTFNTVRVVKMKAVKLASRYTTANFRLWRLNGVGAYPSSTNPLDPCITLIAYTIQRSLGRVRYSNRHPPRAIYFT